MDTIRVLRIIEYSGPRAQVEIQVRNSVHGEREGIRGVTIRAATIGEFPEILASSTPPEPEAES